MLAHWFPSHMWKEGKVKKIPETVSCLQIHSVLTWLYSLLQKCFREKNNRKLNNVFSCFFNFVLPSNYCVTLVQNSLQNYSVINFLGAGNWSLQNTLPLFSVTVPLEGEALFLKLSKSFLSIAFTKLPLNIIKFCNMLWILVHMILYIAVV